MFNKKNYKKYSEKVKEGVKGTAKAFKKYAPKVKKAGVKTHLFLRGAAEGITEGLTPMPHRGKVLNLTPQKFKVGRKVHKPRLKKAKEHKGGFYLDFT